MEIQGKVEFNIFKLILKILYDILIIFCVILIAIILMQKITDSNRSIAGYRIFRVVTGSMIPKYDIGEVVICKEIHPEEIQAGDSIVYKGRIGQVDGKVIMHEVVSKNYDENQVLNFHVKGIANNEEDPEVRPEQIYGVVKHKSPLLTLLYELATSIYSAYIIITVLVINVFISFRVDKRAKTEPTPNCPKEKRAKREPTPNCPTQKRAKTEPTPNCPTEERAKTEPTPNCPTQKRAKTEPAPIAQKKKSKKRTGPKLVEEKEPERNLKKIKIPKKRKMYERFTRIKKDK